MRALLMDSRTRLLLGGLALAGLTVVWTWTGPDAEETAAPPERAAAIRAIQAPAEHVEEPLFAALDVRPADRKPGRDPWRFGAPPAPARLAATPPAVLRPSSEPAPLVPLGPAPAEREADPAGQDGVAVGAGEEVADEAVEVVVAGQGHPLHPSRGRLPGRRPVDGGHRRRRDLRRHAVPVRPGQGLGQQLAEDLARVVAPPTSSSASVAASEAARTSDSSPVM